MQAQHGLRHSDYVRYRKYCAARLARMQKGLRKGDSARSTGGRNAKQQVPAKTRRLDAADVKDLRHLHVPLVNAERAWSHAMELKASAAGGALAPAKRAHLLRKLSKAAMWADLFAKLCAQRADSRTALEAEAYASWMRGSLQLEREDDWEGALSKFVRARAVYEKLGNVGDAENALLCRQRVEELDPSIRYCRYKMGKGGAAGTGELSDLKDLEGPGFDLLQSKIQGVLDELVAKEAVGMAEVTWRGRKVAVRNESTRVCLLKGEELAKELDERLKQADDAGGAGAAAATSAATAVAAAPEQLLPKYDKLFIAYNDAKRLVRDDLTNAVNANAGEATRAELASLEAAISCLLIDRTIERNLLLVRSAQERLPGPLGGVGQGVAGGAAASGKKGGSKAERNAAKPEDLVRLFDILLQNVAELSDLASSGFGGDDPRLTQECQGHKQAFEAGRCLYLGASYLSRSLYAEAMALSQRASERAAAALAQLTKCGAGEAALARAQAISTAARSQRCLAHAQGVAAAAREREGVKKGMSRVSLGADASGKDAAGEEEKHATVLLDVFQEFMPALRAITGTGPALAHVPPPFQSVPCRPMVLDTALSCLEFPVLTERTKKVEKKRGLFGFFRR